MSGLAGMTLVLDRVALEQIWADLQSGRTGTAEQLELRQLAEQVSLLSAFDRLVSLDRNRIEEFPHQTEAALRVLRDMHGRALLADEVGLGKTIEAALVMKEYLVRGMVRSVLILTPPSLTRQWQSELSEKFLLEFPIAEKPEDWERHEQVVGSLDTAKLERHAERLLRRRWDLVIVDEAHRLANNKTLAHRLVHALQRRYLLLLTATPVQNDLRELYNLVTLLRPGQLGSYRAFRSRFVDPADPRKPLNPAQLRGLLSECMVRNRRSQVAVKLPARHARTYATRLHPGERALYDHVAALSRGRHLKGTEMLGRLLLLQQACSTPDAVLAASGEREGLRELAEGVEGCAKTEALLRIARDVDDRVLVFTEFRASQERIRRELDQAGIQAVLFHGGLDRNERAEAVRRFRKEAPVLVSTQSGSEGQNLQFCNVLVNFDLPWNPMRLEQRIGRLHRLGQPREVHIFNLAAAETVEADILELLQNKILMFELVVGELDLILGLMADDASFEHALARIWLDTDNPLLYREGLDNLGRRVLDARERFASVQEAELLLSRVFES